MAKSEKVKGKQKLSAKDLKKLIPPDGTVLEIRKEGRFIKAFDSNGVDLSAWISSNTRKGAFDNDENLRVKMVSSNSWTWKRVSKDSKISKINFKMGDTVEVGALLGVISSQDNKIASSENISLSSTNLDSSSKWLLACRSQCRHLSSLPSWCSGLRGGLAVAQWESVRL